MSMDSDNATVKPTVIDLDPDQVIDEAKPKTAPDAAPKVESNRSGRVVPLVVAALAVGAIAGGYLYRGVLADYWPSNETITLKERIDLLGGTHEQIGTQLQGLERLTTQLKADIDQIEAANAGLQTGAQETSERLGALEARLAALEAAQGELKNALAGLQTQSGTSPQTLQVPAALPPDLIPRIEALEKDVASLKTAEPGRADATALTQALSDLRAKIEAGVSFADEQARIARMVPAAAGLDVLATHAGSGIPAAQALAAELAALKPMLPVPELPAPSAEPGVVDRLLEALSSVITIRDLDAVNWQTVAEQAIAFAESNDLTQALAVIDAQSEAKPTTLQSWRDRAAARIALEAALAAVSESVQRDLAARP